ncbi:carbon-nitrogen hydrolase family protein [Leucobacter denitrificans]|uniref:Carbon-nitrogen hydrolase family protein n=1 Tax=Leucobacter denitrificans TaxID=683042 RepID=A0A7G9S2K5_9MICO|nr:carbon-nitrogen hydrolase family protein [Leucobacter denitrificans]QNN62080.1 carbon-nitrogen hydrolase family protein [Leucobacter denitrificans]
MTDVASTLKIAVWQAHSTPGDVEANLQALDAAAGSAAAQGVDLLITPEMFVTGYNIGDRIRTLAEQQPLELVRDVAKRNRIAIIAGGPEWLEPSGDAPASVANAAWFVDETGNVLARHRKIQLYGDLDQSKFKAGDSPLTLVEYRGFNVAVLICFDVEFPETVRTAALAGADLVAVPTAQMEPFDFVNQHLIRVRAWENATYVAYANQHGPDGELTYVGQSVIADPYGVHLAQAQRAGDELLIADVDRTTVTEARTQNPYLSEVRSSLFQRSS